MAPSNRRISYVIPTPTQPVRKLKLPPLGVPRNGQLGPILISETGEENTNGRTNDATPSPKSRNPFVFPPADRNPYAEHQRHPKHRLGVAAFALDASTQLAGSTGPEGILYTGGRDGMVMAWELGVPMKRRTYRYVQEPIPPTNERDLPADLLAEVKQPRRRRKDSWEVLTGWADGLSDDEDDEEDEGLLDGDIIDSVGYSRRASKHSESSSSVSTVGGENEIPYVQQWEMDADKFEYGKPSRFRQCTQAHSDWVNDLLLCNLNQTVISGSSDGTVKAWDPHSSTDSFPTIIGMHSDYVRCLAHSDKRSWVASGSFDRTIKLWDIAQPRNEPIIELTPPEAPGPKSSVYAIATNPAGSMIASGSPERVVRLWDPRSKKKSGKLVGHTDNIRAIIMSEDGRYLLTGSADASIKLWAIASPQRCLHTFTHHTESVWSLFSAHPSLEIFYSGDRAGLVTRVDVEGCGDISDGECVLACRDVGEAGGVGASEGMSKIVVMDDALLWAATGSSSIKRWRAPGRRVGRLSAAANGGENSTYSFSGDSPPYTPPPHSETLRTGPLRPSTDLPSPTSSVAHHAQHDSVISITVTPSMQEQDTSLNGLPYECLIRLASPNDSFTPFSASTRRGRDAEVATLYSAASVMSVPRQIRTSTTPLQGTFPSVHTARSDTLTLGTADVRSTFHTAAMAAQSAYDARDVAAEAVPLYPTLDCVIPGENGLVRALIMNDRMHALTVDTAGEVAVWDLVRGICLGTYSREEVREACACGDSGSTRSGGESGDERSPRQALEVVRERIEGEAVVAQWSSADTRIGDLAIHLNERCFEAEIYGDEAGYGSERQYSDDFRLNIGKWILRNLFLNFIREEQRSAAIARATGSAHDVHTPSPAMHRHPTGMNISVPPRVFADISISARTPGVSIASPTLTPAIIPETPNVLLRPTNNETSLYPIPQSPLSPASPQVQTNTVTEVAPTPRPLSMGQAAETATVTTATTHPPVSSADYFSLRRRQSVSTSGTTSTAAAPPTPDDFSGWGGPGSAKASGATAAGAAEVAQVLSTPGGFMGRLKNLTKAGRRAATEADAAPAGPATAEAGPEAATAAAPLTPAQKLKQNPLTPPPTSDAPPLSLPPHMPVVISQEDSGSSGWLPIYRGTVATTGTDAALLEDVMPEWLLEYLLMNRAPTVTVQKLSFVLLPVQVKTAEGGDEEQLPELLNSAQSKLSASRFLRVRKLTNHIQEKLDKPAAIVSHSSGTPRSSTDRTNDTVNAGSPNPRSSPTNSHSQSPSKATDSPSARALGLPRAEEVYEILCNDQVLPLDMTLVAVRQFIWRQAGELVMYYRRRRGAARGPIRNTSSAELSDDTRSRRSYGSSRSNGRPSQRG